MQKTIICRECGSEYTYEAGRGPARKICDDCAKRSKRYGQREWLARKLESKLPEIRSIICKNCGISYEFEYVSGKIREYCPECSLSTYKVWKSEWHKEKKSLLDLPKTGDAGLRSCERCGEDFGFTHGVHPGGGNLKYCGTCKPIVLEEVSMRSREKAKGTTQAISNAAKSKARRRAIVDNPESFALRRVIAFTRKEPCNKCGAPMTEKAKGFVLDHKIPLVSCSLLGLPNPDHWRNLQWLCSDCNKIKTGRDLHLMARLKKHIKVGALDEYIPMDWGKDPERQSGLEVTV